MELIFLLFALWVAHKIWPDQKSDQQHGDIFIPFDEPHNHKNDPSHDSKDYYKNANDDFSEF